MIAAFGDPTDAQSRLFRNLSQVGDWPQFMAHQPISLLEFRMLVGQ